MFTLIQISDCHFSADPIAVYRNENPDRNLARLQVGIEAMAPDGLVLTGDISEDGSIESYERVAAQVEGWAPLRAWLPGNHDHKDHMAEVLTEPDFMAGPVLDWGGWRLVLLDSAYGDRGDGMVDDARLAPLSAVRTDTSDRPALAFIHHQPVPVNASWIDQYGMANSELLWDRLAETRVRALGFGHVHQAFKGEKNGIVCLSAPSTVANSQAEMEVFTPDPTGPKARWYRLHDDGRWQTGLISAGMN
ncbi:MAG: metallophosphoesterase [Pseudomonadota bacterium]